MPVEDGSAQTGTTATERFPEGMAMRHKRELEEVPDTAKAARFRFAPECAAFAPDSPKSPIMRTGGPISDTPPSVDGLVTVPRFHTVYGVAVAVEWVMVQGNRFWADGLPRRREDAARHAPQSIRQRAIARAFGRGTSSGRSGCGGARCRGRRRMAGCGSHPYPDFRVYGVPDGSGKRRAAMSVV
jgi:hypothetical protein